MTDPAKLATIDQVCERFGVSRSTVNRLVSRGIMPTLRVGGQIRFDMAELEALAHAGKLTYQPETGDEE